MYNLNIEQIQKLLDLQKNLNGIEVKGFSNIAIMYGAMITLQKILEDLQKQDGAIIDNTKENK
jgi:hypothetical protein